MFKPVFLSQTSNSASKGNQNPVPAPIVMDRTKADKIQMPNYPDKSDSLPMPTNTSNTAAKGNPDIGYQGGFGDSQQTAFNNHLTKTFASRPPDHLRNIANSKGPSFVSPDNAYPKSTGNSYNDVVARNKYNHGST